MCRTCCLLLCTLEPSPLWDRVWLAAPHGSHDLDLVAALEARLGVLRLGRDLTVDGHRCVLALDLEVVEEPVDAEPVGELDLVAVDADDHKKTAPRRVRWLDTRVSRRVPFAGITQCRFEGSRAAPGSQETSPSAAAGL